MAPYNVSLQLSLRIAMRCYMLSLLLLLLLKGVDSTLSYPCPHTPGTGLQASQEMMPKLPQQFVTHVEANIVQKRFTSEAVEVYDYPNKRAAMSITASNKTVTSIFNYDTGERFDIMPDGSCKTLNLNESSFDVFGFTELKTSGQAAIRKAADVFRFGEKYPKQFLGEEKVRGINVYHWQSCQKWQDGGVTKAAYVVDYYFSKPDYTTATSEHLIPVRALVNGTAINVDSSGKPIGGTHNFSHVYDFSFFRPGPIEDDSIFEIPQGTMCDRSISKPLPKLPDRFSLSMEVNVVGNKRPPMTERMLFDYDFGLIQTDRFAPRGMGDRIGLTKLTVVEDYKNHIQYVVDSYDGNCSISALPEGLSTSDGGHGNGITMKHGEQLLRYGNGNYKYQGQRWMRDIKVDVWAAASDSGMVQEIYFLADWPTNRIRTRIAMFKPDFDLSRMNILVGTYLLNTSAIDSEVGPFFKLFGDPAFKHWGSKWHSQSSIPTQRDRTLMRPGDILRWRMPKKRFGWDSARLQYPHASEKMIHIFNYLPMHTDLSAFDVSTCYKQKAQQRYVYFMMEGTFQSQVSNQRYAFMSSTKSALAKAAGISMLRVTNVNVWQDMVSSKLSIFFTMLERPTVNGVAPQLSSEDAYQQLSKAVENGFTITIEHPMRQTQLQVVSGSLKSWDSMDELWKKVLPQKAQYGTTANADKSSQSATNSGYSSGAFGGMAFGMLVLGVLVGVVGMYVVLRRVRPDIHLFPYQQSK